MVTQVVVHETVEVVVQEKLAILMMHGTCMGREEMELDSLYQLVKLIVILHLVEEVEAVHGVALFHHHPVVMAVAALVRVWEVDGQMDTPFPELLIAEVEVAVI